MWKEVGSKKVDLWTARRMSRVAILGALTTALGLVKVPVMYGITLDPTIPAFAAAYYGPFEAYWCYVIAQLIRRAIESPGGLVINPLSIFMGTPCAMILVAWVLRRVRYPLNIVAAVLSGIGFHAFTIFPYCVIYYGWEIAPTVFMLQVIGALIVTSVCFVIALGGSSYMWRLRRKPIFPWRFASAEERFSVASRRRTMLAIVCIVVTTAVAYGFCFSPYASPEFLGPPMSPHRQWADAWIRHPITFPIGWLFWELYKRNAEWLKQTE